MRTWLPARLLTSKSQAFTGRSNYENVTKFDVLDTRSDEFLSPSHTTRMADPWHSFRLATLDPVLPAVLHLNDSDSNSIRSLLARIWSLLVDHFSPLFCKHFTSRTANRIFRASLLNLASYQNDGLPFLEISPSLSLELIVVLEEDGARFRKDFAGHAQQRRKVVEFLRASVEGE